MSGPEQPWWSRPGGAPPPGAPAGRPAIPHRPPPRTPRPNPYGPPHPPLRPPNPHRPDPPRARPAPKPSRTWALAAGAAVGAMVLVAIGWAVWTLGASGGTVLDVHRAEAGVTQILSDPLNGYGANAVAAVVCNNGENPQVRVGATFTCEVDINGTVRRVNVEFTDDDGTYAVDGPR
ncbi:DUF4333 domain-containing protein [Mycobacterium sp. 21AC1]|uniref:DUF4333 domain-containing protein n=1 Tax=[Mycobacterium] appelbergii TaxID=2939269 RepID=UPI002938F604|nr:DUF4333 domain-containing protein [Mycobacterium sp. 21AC1]MDV3127920.1 DUF4333 domain-containing protein [Mycobacterium sp. 21AC1]